MTQPSTTADAATDNDRITSCARDYFEGWFTGDTARMERALHPQLVKRSPHPDPSLEHVTTKARMMQLTGDGAGVGETDDQSIDVEIADVYGDIATAVVRSSVYREYLHLVRTADGWRIVNALWAPGPRAAP